MVGDDCWGVRWLNVIEVEVMRRWHCVVCFDAGAGCLFFEFVSEGIIEAIRPSRVRSLLVGSARFKDRGGKGIAILRRVLLCFLCLGVAVDVVTFENDFMA